MTFPLHGCGCTQLSISDIFSCSSIDIYFSVMDVPGHPYTNLSVQS